MSPTDLTYPAGPRDGRAGPSPRHSPGHALILGATGSIGSAVASTLIARGWRVSAMTRDVNRAAKGSHKSIRWIAGDALVAGDVLAAAEGADLIVHGVNPPGYRNWRTAGIPMLANTIAAAERVGARILFPGNVYNFGPDAGVLVSEDAPQNPTTRKGRVRVDMEAMLRSAAERGVRSLVVRAGDFFGPGVEGSWFSQLIAKNVLRRQAAGMARNTRTPIEYPGGDVTAGHAWAYVPDLAEAMVRLVEHEAELATFDAFHFGGHWVDPGIAMASAVSDAAGAGTTKIRVMPWWPFFILAPFVTFMREALEMRYLWRRPVRLDNRKLLAFLGNEPHTPLPQAVRAALGPAGESLCSMAAAIAV